MKRMFYLFLVLPMLVGAAPKSVKEAQKVKFLQHQRQRRAQRVEKERMKERMKPAPLARWALPSVTAVASGATLGYKLLKNDNEEEVEVEAIGDSEVEAELVTAEGIKKAVVGQSLKMSFRRSEENPPFLKLVNLGESEVECIVRRGGTLESLRLGPHEEVRLFIPQSGS